MQFLEAFVALFPSEAGGRVSAIEPREGSYRPYLRAGEVRLRARVIEGPPQIAPGEHGSVVIEVEGDHDFGLAPGSELDLVEHGEHGSERVVGIVSVSRQWRRNSRYLQPVW